jgi:GcrA cell cycle regulator
VPSSQTSLLSGPLPETSAAPGVRPPKSSPRSGSRPGWTEERIEQLTKFWSEGCNASQIAAALGGVTRNAVLGKVHRLGQSLRPRPSKQAKGQPRLRIRKPILRLIKTEPVEMPPQPFLGIPFRKLKENQCRYPRGDDQDMVFCAQPKMEGSSYCAACHAICYPPPRTQNISDEERQRRRIQAFLNNQRRKTAL